MANVTLLFSQLFMCLVIAMTLNISFSVIMYVFKCNLNQLRGEIGYQQIKAQVAAVVSPFLILTPTF